MVTLVCGDCNVELGGFPPGSVDMLFTDLPYGTTNCKWDMEVKITDNNQVLTDTVFR